MKYYLIAGEASGDLHGSRLMQALKNKDRHALFRFYGGDQMAAVGGPPVKHYREMAYMGFVPVLLHLPTILKNMQRAKSDIAQWRPDVVILIDYPGFNLDIAKYVRQQSLCPVYYYISPKIWAWKEYRIKNIKRDVDELFSILPFEVEFFEKKHHFPIHYVGNPTADEVKDFKEHDKGDFGNFCQRYRLRPDKPIIALLAGSRRQEIKDNLPAMIATARKFEEDYSIILAGAPGIDDAYYKDFLSGTGITLARNDTYALLSHSHAALVTSGTATLETALFGVPQVVCYETPLPRLIGYLRKKVLNVKYISLVNLIADAEIVTELVADNFTPDNMERELRAILDGPARKQMLEHYTTVWERLGKEKAPENAARIMTDLLSASAKSQRC